MRKFLFGVVIASVTAAVPTLALGGDREIANSVMSELQQHKNAGQLKGFDINLRVEDGIVYLSGEVASPEQRSLIAKAAASAAGISNVVDEIQVRTVRNDAVQPASNIELPVTPSIDDEAITDRIVDVLAQAKAAGALRGFDLDVSTVNGDVWIRGSVSNESQKALVLEAARTTGGVLRVIDDIAIIDKSNRSKRVESPVPAFRPETVLHPVLPVNNGTEMVRLDAVSDATLSTAESATAPISADSLAVLPASTEAPLPVPTQPVSAPVAQHAPAAQPATPVAQPMGQIPPVGVPGAQAQAPVSRPMTPAVGPEIMVAAPQQYGVPQQPAMMPMMQYPPQAMPMQPVPMNAGPRPMGAGQMVGYPVHGHAGAPVPMQYASTEMGMGAPRYDQPNLPNYAWPTYAAYPNYAAVTYPKQYSPSAWPYIGPFYPYPQVPLGWRKVSLQWDDGLWYLDFTSK